jgi:hypothetical protein
MSRIYSHFGGINEELRAHFIRSHEDNPQGKYGKHQYSLEDFGLTVEKLESLANGYPGFFQSLSTNAI